MRFLAGKLVFLIFVKAGYSVITKPPLAIILLHKAVFSAGYTVSKPFPKTAMVLPFACKAPIWEYLSIPLAKPANYAHTLFC